ncbi:MAG: 8-amino-7-oxononanoate synthase [Myxococcota bacterium]|jgi:8-amino-7-oxononanoate synthase
MSAIAIVGMGCRFAGAPDLQSFWDLTVEGRDSFGPVPMDRWDHSLIFDKNRRAADKSYASAGAFIKDIRSFPALALGLPPRRVEVMDPQQRFTLEVCLQAIQDSGRAPQDMPHKTGVYIGITASEYRSMMGGRIMAQLMAEGRFGDAPEDLEALANAVNRMVPSRPYTAPGALANMVAAAVAQELDLHGPAFTVDAACASGLIAATSAVKQLRDGSIDAALVGGAYLQITPDNYVAFSRIGAMSEAGRCRPFDKSADGFVQGDGAGALFLKRLEDAERDGDRIYALIDGAAFNNDGRGDGPMAPVEAGQVEVVQDAWKDASRDGSSVGYVETHGTGTTVGDIAEFNALRKALGSDITAAAIGSAKANIGHTMSAAGIAGMIRTAMAIHNKVIPPMAGFEEAKPELHIEGSGFYLPKQAQPWDSDERIAGVSSFGFGGTNAHLVLSNAPQTAPSVDQSEVVCLSAPDEATLKELAGRTAAWLSHAPNASVAGVARAWAVRRPQPARLAIVAESVSDLAEKLQSYSDKGYASGSFSGTWDTPAKVAYLYPGQGSQRTGMLSDAVERFPILGHTLDGLESALGDELSVPLTHLLYPARRETPVSDEVADFELTDTANQQPVLLAAGVGLTHLLSSVGVTPTVVTGHSLGEFTAAVAGGVLSASDAARFVSRRGRAMADLPGPHGAMAAIMSDVDTVKSLLIDGAVIANINHPRQLVISGTDDAVKAVVDAALAADIKAVALKVSHAFHSPVLASLDSEPLLAELDIHDPVVTVASGIASSPYADAAAARQVFARHAISPVNFVGALQQCIDAGANVFVQVGAGGPLGAFARGTLDKSALRGIFNLAGKKDDDGGASILEGVARLWAAGVNLDTRAITATAAVSSVPPEVLPRQNYWAIKDKPQIRVKLATGSGAGAHEVVTVQAADNAPETTDSGDPTKDSVIGVISKVSAYPRTAIRPEMGLISDLGFDSLMVNDLATGLADTFPGLPGIPQELLINRPSVEDIIDFVRRSQGEGGEIVDDDAPLEAYAPVWQLEASDDLPPRPVEAGRRVLVHGNSPLAHAVRDAFVAAGHTIQEDTPDVAVFIDVHHAPVAISDVVAGTANRPQFEAELIKNLGSFASVKPDVVYVRSSLDRWSYGSCGVVRSIPREWPNAIGKAIAIDHGLADADVAKHVVAEWSRSDTSTDVKFGRDGRSVLALQQVEETDARFTPTADDVVAITGGTRGIGAQLAEKFTEAGATILLLGRGDPGTNAQALIDAGKASHIRVDVTDRAALIAAIGDRGVTAAVHAAGVLADGPLGSVDPARGALARAVKVDGWLNLLAATDSTLQVGLVIGSWAGRFGNRHQADYAAANALVAAIAGSDPRGVVAEFGPWTDSDMVASIPAAIQAAMRAEGVDFTGPTVGLDTLMDDLRTGRGIRTHGRNLPTSLRSASFSEVLTTETHPFLLDHAIEGHPVLPLASAADALVRIANPGPAFVIENLKLYQGVVVDEPVLVRTAVRGDRVELRRGDRGAMAYQARIRPLVGDIEMPDFPKGGAAPERSLADFYDFTFHGPLLAGITAIDAVGTDFVVGKVRTGKPSEWMTDTTRERFHVDPLALDSAMQLSAYVAWTRYGRAGTPVALGRYIQLAPLPEGELIASVHFGPAKDDRFTGTIVLRTLDGTPIAMAEDLVAELRTIDGVEELPAFDPVSFTPEEWPEIQDLMQRLEGATLIGLRNPFFAVHDGTAANTTTVAGRELVNYSSYNYIGLSGDERVTKDAQAAVAKYGTSVSASRVASGERPFHGELERELAEAQGAEAALVFTAGHATNVTTLGHLFNEEDLFLHDELIHDSAFQGMRLSGAARRPFKHDDPADLERQLKQLRGHYRRVCIAVEGVYSMDGDICDLPAYIALKKKYGCMLFVDEAHSFGVIGKTGRGIGEHFGIDGREVDIWMGTLSKSLSSCGGWICASKTLIDYLKYTGPGFVFSAGLTAANGIAALSSLRLMHQEPWRPRKLQANAKLFHTALEKRGMDTGPANGESGVIPVITGNSMHALVLSQRLQDQGINVQPIVYPAVADDSARLRFFLSSTHTDEQLLTTAEAVADILTEVQAEYQI